jgi:hypothetical protein
VTETEGVSNGHHEVPDLQPLGIPEGDCLKIVGRDAEQREVGLGVGPDDLCIELTSVPQDHRDPVPAPDHVLVGDHVPLLRVHDHARSRRTDLALSRMLRNTEEASEERILEQRVHLE